VNLSNDRLAQITDLYIRHHAQLHAVVRKHGSHNRAVVDDACAHAWLQLLASPQIDLRPPRWRALAWVPTCAIRRPGARALRRTRGSDRPSRA
jgi:hypothetical protein